MSKKTKRRNGKKGKTTLKKRPARLVKFYAGGETETKDDVYVGAYKDGLMHGHGVLTFANGDKYEGQFEKGEMHGIGKKTFKNGNFYEGQFEKGKFITGKGTFTFENGDSYSGELKNGTMTGKGKLTYENGGFYEGDFENGELITGKGKITFGMLSYKYVYEGDFKNGEMTGKGKKIYENGDFYEGDFENGKLITGKGKKTFGNKQVYEGDFEKGEMTGEGKMTSFVDGTSIMGKFDNGQLDGKYQYTIVYNLEEERKKPLEKDRNIKINEKKIEKFYNTEYMKLQGKNIIDNTENKDIKSFQDNIDNKKIETVDFIVAGEITRKSDNQNIKYGHFVFDNSDTYFVVTDKDEIVFIKKSDIRNIDTAPLERTTTSSVKEGDKTKNKNKYRETIFGYLNRIFENKK